LYRCAPLGWARGCTCGGGEGGASVSWQNSGALRAGAQALRWEGAAQAPSQTTAAAQRGHALVQPRRCAWLRQFGTAAAARAAPAADAGPFSSSASSEASFGPRRTTRPPAHQPRGAPPQTLGLRAPTRRVRQTRAPAAAPRRARTSRNHVRHGGSRAGAPAAGPGSVGAAVVLPLDGRGTTLYRRAGSPSRGPQPQRVSIPAGAPCTVSHSASLPEV
jgi:hypothetical protein